MTAAATMEAQTAQTPSDPSSATYPRWVMFEQYLKIEAEGSSCSTSGDASKTSVAARTSTGLPIQVSLRLAEPPAVSCVCLQIPDGLDARHSEVLAAHGDSVLIKVSIEEKHGYTTDHFVYNAGDAAADPPGGLTSLSLLPLFHLAYHGTGLVRPGGDTLKFVNIFPRCGCGGAGASRCERSRHAYTIHTWTMRIGNDDHMEWVKDGMVDATELWGLDSYKGLRWFPLDHLVVSMDDPGLICFWLHEPPVDGYWEYRDRSVDLLMVNTRCKTIHSVSRYEDGLLHMRDDHLISSNVSYFFNSYPSSGSDGTLIGPRMKGNKRPPPDIVDEQLIRVKRGRASISTNPTLQPALFAEPSVQASEIFEAFEEIPSYGLEHDEVKVYRILSRDNCHRVRSLLRLPKNLRKDWLLMEIKANEE